KQEKATVDAGAFSSPWRLWLMLFLITRPQRSFAQRGDEGGMGFRLHGADAAGQGSGPGRHGNARRGYDGGFDFSHQRQAHLLAADQLEIDLRENLAVEQRAMQGAAGIVDAVMLAQGIEADAGA